MLDREQALEENKWHIATLSEEEKEELKRLEEELDVVLIAYEEGQQMK